MPYVDLGRGLYKVALGGREQRVPDVEDQDDPQGLRVVLDGHDGDGVVSHGEGYLPELAHAGRHIDGRLVGADALERFTAERDTAAGVR